MAVSERLRSLVELMPGPDGKGMLTEDLDKARIEKALAEIYAGGAEHVLGLVDMLGEPGSEEDVKPRYALHGVVNHALVVGDGPGRKRTCEILAGQLASDRPTHVRAFLCQELGWAGGTEAVPALGRMLSDEELAAPAAMALVSIGDGAATEFRRAWPSVKGEARRHIADGLAALAEPASAAILVEALKSDDRELRIAGAAGLSRIGDPKFVESLLKAANRASGWERTQATASCLALAETLAEAGRVAEARRVHEHLRATRTEPNESHVREAAERGLARLD